MAAIPRSTRDSITWHPLDHAPANWPQLKKVQVIHRGTLGFVPGILSGGEQIPLCRLRYGGSAHSFGFAIYSANRAGYQDAVLRTGLPIGADWDSGRPYSPDELTMSPTKPRSTA